VIACFSQIIIIIIIMTNVSMMLFLAGVAVMFACKTADDVTQPMPWREWNDNVR